MIKIDWQDGCWQGKLGAMLFEHLCFDLLDNLNFRNLKWLGRSSGDQGRDIEGIVDVMDPIEKKRTEKWFVECKLSRVGLSATSMAKNIFWSDTQKPDVLLIITNTTLTVQTRQWVKDVSKDKPYKIRTLEGPRLEHLILEHKSLYQKYFERPRNLFDMTILHLLDSDPKSNKIGFALFKESHDKDNVVCSLSVVLDTDGYGRLNAAKSLSGIIELGLFPPSKILSSLSLPLKHSHEIDDDIFLQEPVLATQYDLAIDYLKGLLEQSETKPVEEGDNQ